MVGIFFWLPKGKQKWSFWLELQETIAIILNSHYKAMLKCQNVQEPLRSLWRGRNKVAKEEIQRASRFSWGPGYLFKSAFSERGQHKSLQHHRDAVGITHDSETGQPHPCLRRKSVSWRSAAHPARSCAACLWGGSKKRRVRRPCGKQTSVPITKVSGAEREHREAGFLLSPGCVSQTDKQRDSASPSHTASEPEPRRRRAAAKLNQMSSASKRNRKPQCQRWSNAGAEGA